MGIVSRQRIPMQDGTLLVIGYDPAFASWFALHYDSADEDAAPRAVIGYHPAEQDLLLAERPDAIVCPNFPIDDDHIEYMLTALVPKYLGIHGEDPQPPCMLCGQAPWRSNQACASHPYDALRRS